MKNYFQIVVFVAVFSLTFADDDSLSLTGKILNATFYKLLSNQFGVGELTADQKANLGAILKYFNKTNEAAVKLENAILYYMALPQPSCSSDIQYWNATELIKSKGYDFQVYHLRTKDNFRLEIHRVLAKGKSPSKQYPVWIQHGLESSSADWVCRNISLAYILVDNGYDVWLPNARGNYYSSCNYNKSKSSPGYWDMPLDVPIQDAHQIIDLILTQTGKTHIHYVGHSMGTTIAMGAFSGDLQNKVKALILMSTAYTLQNMKGVISLLPKGIPFWEIFQDYQLLTRGAANIIGAAVSCFGIGQIFYSLVFFLLFGDAVGTVDRSLIATAVLNIPSGAPAMYLGHYIQLRSANRFQKYDFGELGNLEKYNQTTPPDYDISKIQIPTFMYVAPGDPLTTPEDTVMVCEILGNCKGVYLVGDESNGHAFPIVGPEADLYALNKNISDTLDMFN